MTLIWAYGNGYKKIFVDKKDIADKIVKLGFSVASTYSYTDGRVGYDFVIPNNSLLKIKKYIKKHEKNS